MPLAANILDLISERRNVRYEQRYLKGFGRLALNPHCYRTRPLPSQRVVNEHRNPIALSVNVFRDSFKSPTGNLIRRPAHYIVILLRILIDHANPRPRRQIVELIKEHLLPILSQFLPRILASIQPCQ